MERQFLTLSDVCDVLNISASQTYALVRSGDLRAIKVGGRGQWRVAEADLKDYIQRMYAQTEAGIKAAAEAEAAAKQAGPGTGR